jgi:hypothetical protein
MTTVLSVPKNEPVIPDCCNIGVIFRVLAGVSVVVLLGFARVANRGRCLWRILPKRRC